MADQPNPPSEQGSEAKGKYNLQKPTGTIDFLPEDMDKRRQLTRIIEDHFQTYGYQQIMLPEYDFFALYRLRSGEKIINDIFTFYDPPAHRAEKDPELYALRPEFTAPLCRFYISSELMYRPKPQKYYYIGSCFRYDEPKKGRYRQFTQAGVELFGADSPMADAEILIMAMDLMEKLQIKPYTLRINDLTFLRTYLEEHGLNFDQQNKVFGVIDKITSYLRKLEIGAITKGTKEEFIGDYYALMAELQIDRDMTETLENLLHLVGSANEIIPQLKEVFQSEPKTIEAINSSTLPAVCEYLSAAGIGNFVVDCGIARGLDYYTNIVFEIDVPSLGTEKQICGGGRYNKLVEEYGGEPTPATGFAFGFERIIIALESLQKISSEPYRAKVLIAMKEEARAYGLQIANKLRAEGIKVEIDIMNRSFKAISKFVDAAKIPYLLFLGAQEMESKKFTLKNFTTSSQEKDLSFEQVIDVLKKTN